MAQVVPIIQNQRGSVTLPFEVKQSRGRLFDWKPRQPANALETTTPVPYILFLGWMGSQFRHIRKFYDIYADYDLIGSVISVGEVMSLSKSSNVANAIHDLILDLRLTNRPVIIHTFSNGGCIVLSYLLQMSTASAQTFPFLSYIRLTIYDSCPGGFEFQAGYRAIYRALTAKKGPIAKTLYKPIVALAMGSTKLGAYFIPYLNKRVFWNSLCLDRTSHRVFLYSDQDDVITTRMVEGFITFSSPLIPKEKIHKNKFDGSGHVEHFRTFPTEYTRLCHEFIFLYGYG